MKPIAIILVALALIVAVVPQLTDCLSQGRSLTLQNGNTVPMKCHWTALAELGVAVPMLIVGILMWFNKQKESRRTLSILGVILGVLTILFPTLLIGVCASSTMLCNSLMRPTLVLSGIIIMVASLAGLVLNRQRGSVQASA